MRELKSSFRNLRRRWNAETQWFFKYVIIAGITIGAVGVAIPTLPFAIPALITVVAGKMVAVGATAAIVAKFTKLN